MSLLAELNDSGARRSKSAQALAQFILADPQSVLSMPIATLAAAVSVSEPTVNRFCTALGCKGFPDFKLTLAGELARAQPRIARGVESLDSPVDVIAKIFDSTHAALTSAHQRLDVGAVDKVVAVLNEARSIVLCGLGASASVALDAQHKLLRFDTPVIAHTDLVNQRMTASGLRPEDALVCISYTGRTTAMIDVAEIAATRGSTVIGITAPASELAQHCRYVLGVEAHEDTELYTPMSSRIAQLVIIDILATCLALRKGEDFTQHLRQLKQALASTRQPG